MGVLHAACDFGDELRGFAGMAEVIAEVLREAATGGELHAEKRDAVVFADFVDRQDVAVVETGDGAHLGPETLDEIGFVEVVGLQDL